ncbi:tRNA splicing endonuclease SEN2 [Phaffia rhodozyma]|uniref:tRNA-splicing endonuclease subunit Sen2 n=1 Tax=Phaffia rhodozyma TaxID=264483 RepID=A0A0F7SVA7_PHARH|nr:tRNA splicing endonuclease SEN2 [Phaffia rhodozyma]
MTSKGSFNPRVNNNHVYRFPLPLVFGPSAAPLTTSILQRLGRSLLVSSSTSNSILNPKCEGVWDPLTGSVWVTDQDSIDIFWQRGNFGKGSLSRSEPSWHRRKIKEITGAGNTLSAEEVTALRRQERKDFKIARAKHAVLTVEAAERAFLAGEASPADSTATGELERPKRPASNAGLPTRMTREEADKAEEEQRRRAENVVVENLEHMQLMPEEVWYLAWGLNCLIVKDPITKISYPLSTVFQLLVSTSTPFLSALHSIPSLTAEPPRPDNPFLVSYAVYHHYRSLGWVVKPGVKFCVDWLLYKRGVVFSHAEFALVTIPVYADPKDEINSPHKGQLTNSNPIDWAWLSTLNRVNSQVKKTLILVYVTIPPCSLNGSTDGWFCGGDPDDWAKYQIKEVVVRRFVPARMRD